MSVSTDIETVRAHARLVWAGLTLAQRSALRRAGARLRWDVHARCRLALERSGLVCARQLELPYLTPLGLLVREQGLAAEAESAKRKYRRGNASKAGELAKVPT